MFKKNTAVTGFGIGHFINASTGAAVTTGTPTCKRTIDGTGGDCANAAAYNANGAVWEIDLDASDMNGSVIILSFTLTDCLPISYTIKTAQVDVDDTVRLGLTALPNAAAAANGGLPTTNGTKINQTADLTAGQSIGVSGDLSATMKTSVQTAADAAVTANTKIVAIEADTNELQADWTNGGRLDLLVDAIKAITDQINFTGTDVNANASVSLTEGDITDIAAGVAAAIKLTTGWTAGGTLTYAEVVKIIAAAVAGKVIDKAGVAGTIQHLDVEDGTTPIFENIPSNTTSPYRDPTIL